MATLSRAMTIDHWQGLIAGVAGTLIAEALLAFVLALLINKATRP